MRTNLDVTPKQRIYGLFGAQAVLRTKHLAEYRQNEPVPKTDGYLLDGCNYGNIGDLAITYAERRFLQKQGLSIQTYLLDEFWCHARALRSKAQSGAMMFYQGGGNFNSHYSHIDYSRCAELEYLSTPKTLIFPETLSYGNNARDAAEEKYVKNCFARHRPVVCAREQHSFALMRQAFPQNRVILVPDIVLSLGGDSLFSGATHREKTVLFILRHDVEKGVHVPTEEIKGLLERHGYSTCFTDLAFSTSETVSLDDGVRHIKDMVDQMRSSSLVITDRLHGMVLSSLCGTPCLAFPNSGRKVLDVYTSWLSDIGYVRFVQDPARQDCAGLALDLAENGPGEFPTERMNEHFQPLRSEIAHLRQTT